MGSQRLRERLKKEVTDHERVPRHSGDELLEQLGQTHLSYNPIVAIPINDGSIKVENHHYLTHQQLNQRIPTTSPAIKGSFRRLSVFTHVSQQQSFVSVLPDAHIRVYSKPNKLGPTGIKKTISCGL